MVVRVETEQQQQRSSGSSSTANNPRTIACVVVFQTAPSASMSIDARVAFLLLLSSLHQFAAAAVSTCGMAGDKCSMPRDCCEAHECVEGDWAETSDYSCQRIGTKPLLSEYTQRLSDFYTKYNPEKLKGGNLALAETLRKWEGREERLFHVLSRKNAMAERRSCGEDCKAAIPIMERRAARTETAQAATGWVGWSRCWELSASSPAYVCACLADWRSRRRAREAQSADVQLGSAANL